MAGRSQVLAADGMCATSHPLAAAAALDTLRRGGNAVDAAIAGAILLGLCEPQMTGLGGDCFALVKRSGTQEVIALNGSGRSPASADPEVLRARGLDAVPLGTAEAVTIPGAVDAFCALSHAHGRLGLADTLGPIIGHFDAGVPVAPRVAFDWPRAADTLRGAARETYLLGARSPNVGDRFALPGQAEVLRRIARDGRAAFYEGEVARDMIDALHREGGGHAEADFTATACEWGPPIAGGYRGTDLLEHPPNGQGATAILLAAILGRFEVASLDPYGAPRAHLEAEAARLAYDARDRILADPDHATRLAHMLDPATAEVLAARIDLRRASAPNAPPREAEHRDTVTITVVDRDRMAVSLIYSIYHAFGSGIASDRFGILLQNRGAGFTLDRGHPNEYGPGKRPLHTIIPAMLRVDGTVTMPFGVMGGGYQPAGHIRLMSNLLDHGMDLQAAIDAPRSFLDRDTLLLERGYSDAVRAELEGMGHVVRTPELPIGGAQAIRIDPAGYLEGASDPRKDGCSIGY